MADINKLKDKIKSTIYPNGKGAINASDHQALLLDMADGMAETDTKLATLSDEVTIIDSSKLQLSEGYFGAYGKKVGDSYTGNITSASGVFAGKFAVKPGETYKLVGKGNPYAYRGYFIVNESNVITRIIAEGESEYNLEILIEDGENTLYVNCVDYNDANEGVWKVKRTALKDKVMALQEAVSGNELVVYTPLKDFVVVGEAYNLGGNKVGDRYTSTPSKSATSAYMKVAIEPNTQYEIRGIGSPYAFRFFAFLDANLTILELSSGDYDTRENGLILNPPTDAALIIVNFTNYDSNIDGVNKLNIYNLAEVAKASSQPLKDINMVCFGDSITQFDSSIGMRYSDYLSLAGANTINVGIGGTQIRQRSTPSLTPSSDSEAYAGLDIVSLIDAVATNNYDIPNACAAYIKNNTSVAFDPQDVIANLESIEWDKVDVVTIFAGTNDWMNGQSLGDKTQDNNDTTLGAMNHIIRVLLSAHPHVKIYWFTPIVRYIASSLSERTESNWGGNYTTKEGKTLIDYVDAIKEVAENNCIPVCDMYKTMGWNKYNFSQYFDDNDGTHPYKGFKQIANRIQSFILANL